MSRTWRQISTFLGFGLGAGSLFGVSTQPIENHYYVGSDGRLETERNWQDGIVPSSSLASTNLIFGKDTAAWLELPASGFAAHGLSFTSDGTAFLLSGPLTDGESPTLALGSGGIELASSRTAKPNSVRFSALNVALASDQTWDTGTGSLLVEGTLSGSGSLSKEGTGTLVLSSDNGSYAGDISLNAGTTRVGSDGALGTGTVTLSGSARLEAEADGPTGGFRLNNAFVVGDNATFAASEGSGAFSIGGLFQTQLKDTVVRLGEKVSVYLREVVASQSGAGASLTVRAESTSSARGSLVLYDTAVLDDSISSLKADGATLLFASNALLGASPVISAENKGIVGVMGQTLLSATSAQEPGAIDHNELLQWTLANIGDKAAFDGTLSLDTLPGSPLVAYSGSGEFNTIDLSGFSSSTFTLGSTTQASIDSGTTIVPPGGADGVNRFGDGGGRLFVDGALGGSGLSLVSPSHSPLTLVLSGTNDYSGPLSDYTAYVEHSFLVLNNDYALPSSMDQDVRSYAKVNLGDGGYLSVTDRIGLGAADLFARLGSYTGKSVIGFDSFDYHEGPVDLEGDLDLSDFATAPYVGTMTGWHYDSASGFRIPEAATIKAPQDGVLKFVAVGGRDADQWEQGTLILDAPLTKSNGVFSVVYGHPDADLTFGTRNEPGRYVLGGSRDDDGKLTVSDYEGGTAIYGGQFELNGPYPFGKKSDGAPGSISVLASAGTVSFKPLQGVELGGIVAYNESLLLGNEADASSTLGIASLAGTAEGRIVGSVSLQSANADFSGGFVFENASANLFARNDTSLGTGAVALADGLLQFGDDANNPVVWNLSANGGSLLIPNEASSLTLNFTQDSAFYGQIAGAAGDGTSTEARLIVNNDDGSRFILGAGDQLYSGGTQVNGGALIVQASSTSARPLGSQNAGVTLNGANLSLRPLDENDPFGPVVSNPIVFGPGDNTLSGSGTFASSEPITIGEYATVSPGAYSTLGAANSYGAYTPPAAGTLTFYSSEAPGTLTFAGGGEYDLVIVEPTGAAGVGYSTVFVNGTLDVTADASSKFVFNIITADSQGVLGPLPPSVTPGTTFSLTVVSTTGGITFNGQPVFNGSALGFDFSNYQPALGTSVYSWSFALDNDGHDLVLNFTPVPEPETWAMLAAGSVIVLFPRFRRLFASRGKRG